MTVKEIEELIDFCIDRFKGQTEATISGTVSVLSYCLTPPSNSNTQAIGFAYDSIESEEME